MAAGSVDDTSWREDERHGVFEIPIEVPLRRRTRRRTSFAGHSKTRLLSFSLSTGRHAPVLEAGAWSTMQCTILTNVPATSSTSKALAQCSKMVFAFPFVAILARSLSCGLQEMQVEA